MQEPAVYSRTGFTLVELLIVVAIISILASMLLPGLARAMEAARRAQCASNLRQVGMALRMYADEANGLYPPVQEVGEPGCLDGTIPPLMFRGVVMYPEYLTDPEVLVCPSDVDGPEEYENGRWRLSDGRFGTSIGGSTYPCLIDDLSYQYFPWVVRDRWVMDEATYDYDPKFFNALQDVMKRIAKGEATTADWEFEDDSGDRHPVYHMRHGVNRFLIKDINNPWRHFQSDTGFPIMFDRVSTLVADFNHIPGGANILFMDGHVEYTRYPALEPYPVTRAWATMTRMLDADMAIDSDR